MKVAIYPVMMFLETAIKNVVFNTSVIGLQDDTFDAVFKERMQDNMTDSKQQLNRLKLRNAIYSRISGAYKNEENKENQMVRHFYNRGKDVPVWCVSEIIYMSDLAAYFSCLDLSLREKILLELGICDNALDTNKQLLSNLLFTIYA